jgi:N,N'-diacetyllegionaminate synthase
VRRIIRSVEEKSGASVTKISIGNRTIGPGEPVFLTLDIGKNFIDVEEAEPLPVLLRKAQRLIDAAIDCGVDAVKFQTHVVEDEQRALPITSPHFNKTRYEWLQRNSFPKEWWASLFRYAEQKGIIAYSTPMSVAAAEILDSLGIPLFKIGSGDVTDLVLLEAVAKTGKPVILSSGMSTMEELRTAVALIRNYNQQLILMHCVSEYPCPPEHLNLNVIKTLQEEFTLPVGLSDHVLENETAFAAVALGAVAIEKHFTFDRGAYGPDHKVGLLPDEVKALVRGVRIVEKALGTGVKTLLPKEEEFRRVFHKSVVARALIPEGAVITRAMLAVKRPGGGIEPKEIDSVAGKRAKRAIPKDALLRLEDVQ